MNDNASLPSVQSPSSLGRLVLRAIYALVRVQCAASTATLRVVVPAYGESIEQEVTRLLDGGLIVRGGDVDDLRLTMGGLALAVAPRAVAFERRRSARIGVRKVSRSVA